MKKKAAISHSGMAGMRNPIPMDAMQANCSWTPTYYAGGTAYDNAGMNIDTRGRSNAPKWPNGGMIGREIGDRNYTVQAFTGYPLSTVGAGQWRRGKLVQFKQPTSMHSARLGSKMYDPTDTNTWLGSNN
jgi:hypothetical protein